jgi:hypothetical protein
MGWSESLSTVIPRLPQHVSDFIAPVVHDDLSDEWSARTGIVRVALSLATLPVEQFRTAMAQSLKFIPMLALH